MLEDISSFDLALLADTSIAPDALDRALANIAEGCSVLALVGPEGGWSESERHRIVEAGAIPVRLAPTILRTETAAVAVCAAVAIRSLGLRST